MHETPIAAGDPTEPWWELTALPRPVAVMQQ